jgi:hypothetical protein
MTGQQDCLALTADDDTFNMAPDFDSTTLPDQGQAATGWDESLSGYWANPGAGTGATGTLTTETPAAGSEATAMPDATATTTTDTGTVATATSTTGGTGTGTGQGSQQVQGVILATDVLGSTVMVSPQGNDQGTGTGTTDATATPAADSTAAANTPDPNATATTDPGTGGAGTGTGDMSQGTVEDIILDPETGDLQYLVVSFGADDRWFPLPIGFLNWDATTNGFVVKVNANALQNAPAFSADQFPDTSAEGWDQEWQGFWQNNGGTGTGTGTGGTTISTATATP